MYWDARLGIVKDDQEETQEMANKHTPPRLELAAVHAQQDRPGVEILYEQVKGLEMTVDRLREQLRRREQEAQWQLEELQRLRDKRPPEGQVVEKVVEKIVEVERASEPCCGNFMTCMNEECIPRLQHQEQFWRDQAHKLEARDKRDREEALKMHRLRTALLECLRSADAGGDKA